MATKKEIIQLVNKNSLEFYILIQKKKVSKADFYQMISNGDLEELNNLLASFEKPRSFLRYTKKYTKLDYIDEVLDLCKNKYHHLREIRNVVYMDSIVDSILDDNTYKQALCLYYTKQILVKLNKEKLDITDYLKIMETIETNLFKKMMKKIDEYYIQMITK